MYRVWRYRGGRDGHETLQQFMNFLGREKTEPEAVAVIDITGGRSSEGSAAASGQRSEVASTEQADSEGAASSSSSNDQRDKRDDIPETTDERPTPNTYAGVVVFCVPIAAETGRGDVDFNTLQVWKPILNFLIIIRVMCVCVCVCV